MWVFAHSDIHISTRIEWVSGISMNCVDDHCYRLIIPQKTGQ